jgi:spore coat polysaccharide biosynthesis protein SpsF (cytidylyltransferase family)
MNVDIFIPVRLTNTRLPSKALKICNGKPLILNLIDRLSTIKKVRNIVVCTTISQSNDPLVELLNKENILVFRGSERDTLNRFLGAAKQFEPDVIINVDGDDIYTDPEYIELLISKFEDNCYDFIDMVGFPFGFRSVGFTKNALEKLCKLKNSIVTDTHYRDFFIKSKLFKINYFKFDKNIIFPKNLRLTLDYPEDYEIAKKIFETLGNDFHLNDIIKLFQKEPELLKITQDLDKKWEEHYYDDNQDFSLNLGE